MAEFCECGEVAVVYRIYRNKKFPICNNHEIICPNCKAREFLLNLKKTTQWHVKYWSCICKNCNHYFLEKR